jgi:hypothetical protein
MALLGGKTEMETYVGKMKKETKLQKYGPVARYLQKRDS